jgi:hypothetical protein
MAAIQQQARARAQVRADSIKAEKAKAEKISADIYTLLNKKRTKDATRMFDKEKPFLTSAMDKNALEMLELSINHGAQIANSIEDFIKHKNRALDYTARIYALIEKNEIREAHSRFNKYKKPLQKYLDKNTFQMLEMTVTQSYKQMGKKKKKG